VLLFILTGKKPGPVIPEKKGTGASLDLAIKKLPSHNRGIGRTCRRAFIQLDAEQFF
jgi:hypothetical protein